LAVFVEALRAGMSAGRVVTCEVRFHLPSTKTLRRLVGERLLSEEFPSADVLRRLFLEHPGVTMLAGTRAAVRALNIAAVEAVTENVSIVSVPVVVDDGVEDLAIFVGARVMLTLNMNKQLGAVNGAFGIVQHILPRTIVVNLDSGVNYPVHLWTIRGAGESSSGFPVTLAYACTIAKMQGRTLRCIAVLPDVHAPGLGYVAITRVQRLRDLLWLSRPQPRFFLPATNI
jgi:hypothetical protein